MEASKSVLHVSVGKPVPFPSSELNQDTSIGTEGCKLDRASSKCLPCHPVSNQLNLHWMQLPPAPCDTRKVPLAHSNLQSLQHAKAMP